MSKQTMSNHQKRILQTGEEYYLCGSNTKVRVTRPHISKATCVGDRSEVRILEATKDSKYHKKIGKLVTINNQVLYPRKNPKYSKIKSKIDKWKEN